MREKEKFLKRKNTCLIFTGGESPSPELTEVFFKCLPPVSFIIAADSGLDTLNTYRSFFSKKGTSLLPNVILGDMDSISSKELLKDFSATDVKYFPKDKDFTDTELALKCARSLASDSFIVLVGGNGGRPDHFLGIYDTFSFDYRCDCWLCGEQLVFLLPEGYSLSACSLKESDYISIARLSNSFSGGSLVSKGLEWKPSPESKKGMVSLSNRICKESGGSAEFYVKKGEFLIFLPLTANFCIRGSSKSQTRFLSSLIPSSVNPGRKDSYDT